MTKEDKQIIDRAVKENWRIGDRTRLKRLLEKNLKQYREKVELENKIADIKANCDLAIEGRDIKIMELEKENERLKGDLELWESGGCRATNLFECGVVKELKEKIEVLECDNYNANCNLNLITDHLTKAKEIISAFVEWANWEGSNCPSFKSIQDKAEQFLNSEVVKC